MFIERKIHFYSEYESIFKNKNVSQVLFLFVF